jgi:hypothetical protein
LTSAYGWDLAYHTPSYSTWPSTSPIVDNYNSLYSKPPRSPWRFTMCLLKLSENISKIAYIVKLLTIKHIRCTRSSSVVALPTADGARHFYPGKGACSETHLRYKILAPFFWEYTFVLMKKGKQHRDKLVRHIHYLLHCPGSKGSIPCLILKTLLGK